VAAPDQPHAGRSRRSRYWRRIRLHDRRIRLRVALVALLVTGLAGVLLAIFGATLFAPRPHPVPSMSSADDAECMPAQIQSFDNWQLARVERAPVAAPKKKLWERAFGSPAAVQAAIKDRLAGWPSQLVVDRSTLPRDPAAFAQRLAHDTWRGLDALRDREHAVPLDTVAFGEDSVDLAVSHIGDYTSTTNIGLHLIDVVAALDLTLLSEDEARQYIGNTLTTLEGLDTDNGFFFNYYDTTSLEPTSQFVSFVDSGWLAAGLMVARMAFPELYERCSALLDRMRFGVFYDPGYDLISHGFFTAPRGPSRYHYGVLYTEARLGTLIAIGKGDVPESVWFSMVRTFPAACNWQSLEPVDVREKSVLGHTFTAGYYEWGGTRYVPSWGGSMFEALMPTLVVDEAALAPKSLGPNGRAHIIVQQRFAARSLGLSVWGLSPSATPGSERYGEYGVKVLGSLGYPPGPVTPHASALALGSVPHASLTNLRRLAERYEVYGEYGFYDAVDPRTKQVAYKYLTLDQSMIFLALANHLADHAVQKRFTSDPIIQRVLPLLAAEDFFE
jgi:hypothetical protein